MKEDIEKLITRLKVEMNKLNNQQAELLMLGNNLAANYKSGRYDATGSIICDLVELLKKEEEE